MNKAKLGTAIGAMLAAGIFSGNAAAGSSTGSLTVQSSVAQSCVVSTTATVSFGAYDPVGANAASALPGTGTVSIKCTKGSTGVDIDLDKGLNAGAGTQRKMLGQNNGDLLNYNVTQPAVTSPWTSCAGSTAWGTTSGGSTYTPTVATWSATAANTFTVCGSVPAAQNVSADALYQDTVTVTVNF